MRILFRRVDPRSHRLSVTRVPHPAIDVVLESRSMLLHDMAHYAVEAELGTEHGFWGLLASGTSLDDLRSPEALTPAVFERLMDIERRVALTQTTFKKGRATGGAAEWLRRVHGAWSKTRQGQALALTWPPGPPEVVPAP